VTPFEKWNVFKLTLQKEFLFVNNEGNSHMVHLKIEKHANYELVSMVCVEPANKK